jgi:hypothetical protein
VRARIALDRHAYRAWDVAASAWSTRHGDHELRIGRSSADVAARLVVRR